MKLLAAQQEQLAKTIEYQFAFLRSAIRGIPGVIMPANPPDRGTMGGGFGS